MYKFIYSLYYVLTKRADLTKSRSLLQLANSYNSIDEKSATSSILIDKVTKIFAAISTITT